MGKKKQNDEAKKEKPVYGSCAEPKPVPKDDGLVKCVCTVPCAWRGYHDEGDMVMVERELLEGEPFFMAHFKPLEPLAGGETASADVNADGGTVNADGEGESITGGEPTAGGEDGQGELGLK